MPKIVPPKELASYIGQDLGCSEWMRIDQERIDRFAAVTEDRQFIHIDPDEAGKTAFGGTVAHGFLTMSLLTCLTQDIVVVPEGMTISINYGFDKVRLVQPVLVDSDIRAKSTLLELRHKQPGQLLMKSAVTVEIRGQSRPALYAEWLALIVTEPD